MLRISPKLLACLFPLLLLAPGCSKENNVDQSQKTTNNIITGELGEDGGRLGSTDGLGVFIKDKSLASNVEITLRAADVSEYSAPVGLDGEVYSFEPHDAPLFTDADIYLPRPDVSKQYTAQISADGVTWTQVRDSLDYKPTSVHFESPTFGYFALVAQTDGPITDPVDAPGGGGAAGAAGGPTAGNSGMTGTGGTTGAGENCKPEPAPVGSTDASGNLTSMAQTDQPFAPVDGFVASLDLGGKTQVSLVLSDQPEACGAAIAAGSTLGDAGRKPLGRAASTALGVTFEVDGALASGTFPLMDAISFQYDSMCSASPVPQGNSGFVELMDVTADRVTGTISWTDEPTGRAFSGGFELPRCALPEAPAGRCCPQ